MTHVCHTCVIDGTKMERRWNTDWIAIESALIWMKVRCDIDDISMAHRWNIDDTSMTHQCHINDQESVHRCFLDVSSMFHRCFIHRKFAQRKVSDGTWLESPLSSSMQWYDGIRMEGKCKRNGTQMTAITFAFKQFAFNPQRIWNTYDSRWFSDVALTYQPVE